MTTLQEAVKKFIEATKLDRIEFEDWPRDSQTAFETLRTALAQQGEQPVAYITDTEQGPMVWTPEMYDEACTYCDDGEFPVPLYTAAPAPQPAQELTGCACRWDADDNRVATCVRHQGWLDVVGEWAERAKAADAALQSAQPVAQPLSDSEIEKLREKTFSTYNPYCPVDSKSMRKAVRAAEAAHGIREVK